MTSVKSLQKSKLPPFRLELSEKHLLSQKDMADQFVLMHKHIKRGIHLNNLLKLFDIRVLTQVNKRNENIFHVACRLRNTALVVQLLQWMNQQSVEIQAFFRKAQLMKSKSGMLPLHHALANCLSDEAALELLDLDIVRRKAVRVATELTKFTPLHLACARTNISEKIMDKLMKIEWVAEEGWKQSSSNGVTPLFLLCEKNRCPEEQMLRLLDIPSVAESLAMCSPHENPLTSVNNIMSLLAQHFSFKVICKAIQVHPGCVNQLMPTMCRMGLLPAIAHLFESCPDILYTLLSVETVRKDVLCNFTSKNQESQEIVTIALMESQSLFAQLSETRSYFSNLTAQAIQRLGKQVVSLSKDEFSDIVLKYGALQFYCHKFVLSQWATVCAGVVDIRECVVSVSDLFPLEHTLRTFIKFLYGSLSEEDLRMSDTQLSGLIHSVTRVKWRTWSYFVYSILSQQMCRPLVWKILQWNHESQSALIFKLCFDFLKDFVENVLLCALDDKVDLNSSWMRVVIERFGVPSSGSGRTSPEKRYILPLDHLTSPILWQRVCHFDLISNMDSQGTVDLTIVDEDTGHRYRCHRAVLSQCCPYFYSLLVRSGMKESVQDEVKLFAADVIMPLLFHKTEYAIHPSDVGKALIFTERYQLSDGKKILLASFLEWYNLLDLDSFLEVLREAQCTQKELLERQDIFENISKDKLVGLWVDCFAQIGGCSTWSSRESWK
mmetsp:Transcript_5421/g.20231  ORF Transcript_5421/g.20231 Transcript_5421/m.20231 type:complete len:721 (+) Transcript_5421:860-3022(+)